MPLELMKALRLDLLQTVYKAYIRLGLFKGNPADNVIARQWLAAIESDQFDTWVALKRCLVHQSHIKNALFRYAYLNGAINRRNLNYLLANPKHRESILTIIAK